MHFFYKMSQKMEDWGYRGSCQLSISIFQEMEVPGRLPERKDDDFM